MQGEVRLLVVDDNYEKSQFITYVVKSAFEHYQIDYSMCSNDAINKMKEHHYDLLIVDLQIPPIMGEQINVDEGKKLVEYCAVNQSINRPTHIIGITSHSDSYSNAEIFFREYGWPLLQWGKDNDLLERLINNKTKHSYKNIESFDIAFVTALHHVELEAVLDLPYNWEELIIEGDNNKYYTGKVNLSNGEEKSVVATSCSHMGMTPASATTMKVCMKFSPKILFMPGIAAGVEKKTQIGDILVAESCRDWGSGKLTNIDGVPTHLNAPHYVPIDNFLHTIFKELSTNRQYLDEINSGWKSSNRPNNSLSVHIGPLATGAVVLEDSETLGNIISQHRETIGVEMEGYGFSYACSVAGVGQQRAVVIKSVCDFANTDKNDNWQDYAAYTSAQYIHHFIVNHLSDKRLQ